MHNSVLLCLSKSLSYLSDLILHNKHTNAIYILELTVGFESNLKTNSERKLDKYRPLILSLSSSYQKVKFVNVSMSALSALDSSCDSLMELLKDLDFPEKLRKRVILKIMNIAILTKTYHQLIKFCRRRSTKQFLNA